MGMPESWALAAWLAFLGMVVVMLVRPLPRSSGWGRAPRSGRLLHGVNHLLRGQWLLLLLKLLTVFLFLAVMFDGLYGTPDPQRNLATQLTWNYWWTGLVVAILLVGSGWCAICPWESLATWLTRRNMMGRPNPTASLGWRVPRWLRGVWPALVFLLLLTWLELGYGITAIPYATALLALAMVVATTVLHALFERKAFCRYFCPVGRTIGFYAQLAPVALRRIDPSVCADCEAPLCRDGTRRVEACPTGLNMKHLRENTYCTSCGNCLRSCPHENVAWRWRPFSSEARQEALPRGDEAWFMLALLALALLHGLTMVPAWSSWIALLGHLLGSGFGTTAVFAVAMCLFLLVVALLYALAVAGVLLLHRESPPFSSVFVGMGFSLLPLALSYHIAHSFGHLLRESVHAVWLEALLPFVQVVLLAAGCWLAMDILRRRGSRLRFSGGWQLTPLALFVWLVAGLQLWLLDQPMVMRL